MELDGNGLPCLGQFCEEGFVDCVFKVQNLEHHGGHYHFDLRGSFAGQPVGLKVRLISEVGPGFDADMQLIHAHVYRAGVVLSSLGAQTEGFTRALASLYEMPLNAALAPTACEALSVVALQQEAVGLADGPIRLKLFGQDEHAADAERYYESFFNVDLRAGFVYWNEKDTAYRAPMLRALAALAPGGMHA
ncbi:hypothetical protein G3435_11295 [Pseudomonas sp. MAFF212428]|uniref:Uncharacterized protein n=1 Tax=Pseudomonas brassicae TaxID=2708063 RepID=A0A6B3P2W6_9PSED|nr:hypothetical protein [Pseudomonas brassicae]NER60411.1 hypothetical protein [Pseudomonas brassicae]NER66084.1 hypothetical protein [Pseudomonas brassicae]